MPPDRRKPSPVPRDEFADTIDSFLREVAAVTEAVPSESFPAIPLDAGEIVGDRFRIEHPAGKGGMGTVYRATDLTTGTRSDRWSGDEPRALVRAGR